MTVAVVCTVLNEAESALAWLDAIDAQTRRPDEVIVLDGGSTDGTVEMLAGKVNIVVDHTCNIHHTVSPVARGRNEAIAYARADVVVVTDMGCVPDKSFVERLVAPIESGAVVAYGRTRPHPSVSWFTRLVCSTLEPPSRTPENASARAFAIRKDCHVGYPEKSLTGEDTAYNRELLKTIPRERFVYVHDAVAYWFPPEGFIAHLKEQFLYAKGDGVQRLRTGWYVSMALRLVALCAPLFSVWGWAVWGVYLLSLFRHERFRTYAFPLQAAVKVLTDAARVMGHIAGRLR